MRFRRISKAMEQQQKSYYQKEQANHKPQIKEFIHRSLFKRK